MMKIFQSMGLLIFLLGMIVFFNLASPYFLTWGNITGIFIQSAILIVTAMGMTLVIATGGIDLSCGSILALSGVICAGAMKSGMGVFAGISMGLCSGALMGMFNAVMIAGLSIFPFIVTLGSAGIYRAIALILTEARALSPAAMCQRINYTIPEIFSIVTAHALYSAVNV